MIRTLLVALLFTAAPLSSLAARAPLDEARDALDTWRLSDADQALRKAPAGRERELLRARAALMRSDAKAAIQRLTPLVAKETGEEDFEARVVLGRALLAVGNKQDAARVLDAMAEAYNQDRVTTAEGLMWLAVGMMLTDYPKDAHRMFRDALEADPKLGRAKLLRADFYASKYDYRRADPLYRELGRQLMALVGRARVAIGSDRAFGEAVELMTPLIESSPECVPCHNVLAIVDLNNELPEEAARRLEDHALAVAPADGEALALLGAAYFLLDDEARYATVEKRALAVNPRNADFYATVAGHAEREHRYDEAIALLEKALKLDPDHHGALGMLGTGYSRIGADEKAARTLERAYENDPYNVRVYNLLAHFYDQADRRYTWFDAAPMRVRADKDQAELLERVVPPLLVEAEAALSKRYGARPEPPLHIEIFKNTATFAVRSTGLPRLAAHGICFGHVITARSPSAGDFNWAEVLWHELAHVYHIQLSRARVPRWFTEGLAVLESLEARPAWEREQDRQLRAALRNDRLRGVEDFNLAFTRAKSIDDILVAYYQAFQVTRFIRDTWGFDAMKRMLELWGQKKKIDQVFGSALEIAPEEFDRRFFGWLEQELAYLDAAYPFDPLVARGASPERTAEVLKAAEDGDAEERADGALIALARGDAATAKRLADLALADDDVAKARYVRAILALKDPATRPQAAADWEALRERGRAGVDGLAALAALAADGGDLERAAKLWSQAARLDPKSELPLARLSDVYDRAGRARDALATRKQLMGVDQANAGLAVKVLGALGPDADPSEVRAVAEQALHIAPFAVEVHLARARAFKAVGMEVEANRAAELALIVDPDNAEAKGFGAP